MHGGGNDADLALVLDRAWAAHERETTVAEAGAAGSDDARAFGMTFGKTVRRGHGNLAKSIKKATPVRVASGTDSVFYVRASVGLTGPIGVA
jgi:hypothetical protein